MKEKIEKLLDIETLDRNLFRGQGGGLCAGIVGAGHTLACVVPVHPAEAGPLLEGFLPQ